MTGHRVDLPDDEHTLIEFRQRDLPGFAVVNAALKDFEPKIKFSWQLSLLIRCVDLIEYRLPSSHEQKLLYSFEDWLDSLIKAQGNALFLARVTHDGLREIIWRVHNPDTANSVLRDMLGEKDYPREFDYRMDDDPLWDKARWHLSKLASQ